MVRDGPARPEGGGVSDDFLARVGEMLIGRWSGPMWIRLVFQPTIAAVLAVRAGLRDARAGRPAFLWELLRHREQRSALLREGRKDVGKVFLLALALDLVYEVVVYHWIYPLQAVVVAAALAFVPYVLLRGPVTRLFRHRRAA
jgi:hypothetical protein